MLKYKWEGLGPNHLGRNVDKVRLRNIGLKNLGVINVSVRFVDVNPVNVMDPRVIKVNEREDLNVVNLLEHRLDQFLLSS